MRRDVGEHAPLHEGLSKGILELEAVRENSRRMKMSLSKSALLVLILASSPVWAESEVDRGRLLVETNCSGCHAIGADDVSRHPDAPAFRTLSERYPIDSLAETLTKGIPIGHPDMPDFLMTASQIDEIIAYIMSVQPR